MIQIYLISEESRAVNYGVGTYIRQMSKVFQDIENLELIIVHFGGISEEVTLDRKDGILHIIFPSEPIMIKVERSRYYRNAWFWLKNYTKEKKSDGALFLLNFHTQQPLISLIRKDFSNAVIYYIVHYFNWSFKLKGNTYRFQQILADIDSDLTKEEKDIVEQVKNDRIFLASVDRIIVLCDYAKNVLLDYYGVESSRIRIVPNGLYDSYYPISLTEKQKIKIEFGLDENVNILLFVGRLDSIKGVDVLINAFQMLSSIRSDCRLLIVGDGDYSKYFPLCQGAYSRITFIGKLPYDMVYKAYQIADIGIMPSFHEQCSYVGIEMLMYGLPLVGSSSTGLSDMMRNIGNEWTLPIMEDINSVSISAEYLTQTLLSLLVRLEKEKAELFSRMRNIYNKRYNIRLMEATWRDELADIFSSFMK